MKVFSIFGFTDSGKTTTAEQLIREFKRRGYSVGSVKEIHNEAFRIDTEGTDTSRHRLAGAELVTARGLQETDILFPSKLSIDTLLKLYTQDIVVLEGVRDAEVQKILCASNESDIQKGLDGSVFAISGNISNSIDHYGSLPVVNAVLNVKALADLVEERVLEYEPKHG